VTLRFLPFFFLLIRRPPRSPLFPYTTPSDLARTGAGRRRRRAPCSGRTRCGSRSSRCFCTRTARGSTTRSWSSSTSCSWACRSRSEEHTSELQSQSNLVCRLLLEKKKTNKTIMVCMCIHHTLRGTRDFIVFCCLSIKGHSIGPLLYISSLMHIRG